MPKRWCKDCRSLFDMDTTGTQRCPACQATADARRNARTNTSRRGYGSAHQKKRDELLAKWRPGDPCARCGKPMWDKHTIDLGHTDDRTGYRGLEHRTCNRGNG